MPSGGARSNSGPKKGTKYASTLSKEQAREVVRQMIMKRLKPVIDAQIAAAVGTHKLMLRRPDGTWRPATTEDDIEKALNGDPNMYWIAPNPPNTQAAATMLAYALDKPAEQTQRVELSADDALIQALQAGRLRAAKAKQLEAPVIEAQVVPVAEPRKVQ